MLCNIQDVVDQILLSGTLYEDLIRTLKLESPVAAARNRAAPAGWTSSELLVAIPNLRTFC